MHVAEPREYPPKKLCRAYVFLRLLPVCVVLFTASCSRTDGNSEQKGSTMRYPTPAEAVVVSVHVHKHEIREGMRKVGVTVEVKGATSQKVTVTEWVPVVLLDRLAVGRTVRLINDPREEDRVTLGL